MKRFLLVFITCMELMIVTGCDKREKIISFSSSGKSNGRPCVKSILSNEYGDISTLLLDVDTATLKSTLNVCGIEKLFGSMESFWDYVEKKGISKECVLAKKVDISVYADLCLQDIHFKNVKFELNPNVNRDYEDDGLLSYTIFSDFDRITFDFKSEKIVLNGEKVKTNIVPLKKDVFSTSNDISTDDRYLFIPAMINDYPYEVLIDTCFSSPNYVLCVPNDMDVGKLSCLYIGDKVFENIEMQGRRKCEFPYMPNDLENVFVNTIILGNAFFQNHRIQLDFEKMQFSMD